MVEKWIHLTELGGDPWVLPIWTSVNNAASEGKVQRISKDQQELGVYISTRLNFLPRIVSRVNSEVATLISAVKTHTQEHEFSAKSEGASFQIDDDLKYQLLVDLDSLLFELNSVCELMGQLFEQLHKLAGKSMPKEGVGLSIKSVLDNANQDSSWFVTLDNHRNFFLHNGSPYIAIDISPSLNDFDILIMKENIKRFEDDSKYLRSSDLNKIVSGFAASKPVIQKYLRDLFQG